MSSEWKTSGLAPSLFMLLADDEPVVEVEESIAIYNAREREKEREKEHIAFFFVRGSGGGHASRAHVSQRGGRGRGHEIWD